MRLCDKNPASCEERPSTEYSVAVFPGPSDSLGPAVSATLGTAEVVRVLAPHLFDGDSVRSKHPSEQYAMRRLSHLRTETARQNNTPPRIENLTPSHVLGALCGLAAVAGEQMAEGFRATYRRPVSPPKRAEIEPEPIEVGMTKQELMQRSGNTKWPSSDQNSGAEGESTASRGIRRAGPYLIPHSIWSTTQYVVCCVQSLLEGGLNLCPLAARSSATDTMFPGVYP